jgi:MFS family permease
VLRRVFEQSGRVIVVRSARLWQGILGLPAAAQRALLHSLLFGCALSVAELLFNFYLASLGYAADVAGLFSTVLRLAGVALGIPAGMLIDRLGAQRSLIGSMLIYALSWIVMLSVGALPVLLIAQLFVGGAYTVAMAAVITLLAATVDGRDRTRVFGLNASATLIIGLFGNALGGALPALAAMAWQIDPQSVGAYRIAMAAIVILALLAVLPLLRMPAPAPLLATQASLQAAPRRRLSMGTMLRLSTPSLMLGAAGGWILPFQNLYLRQEFGMSDGAIGATLGWIALALGIGALVGSPLSERIGTQRAAALLRVLSVPAMLLMAFTPLLPLAIIGLIVRGVAVVASYPLYDSMVMDVTPPRQRGMSAGMLNLTWALGWAVCAALSGLIQVRYGFMPVLIASAACYAVSSWSIWAFRPPQ